MDQKTKPLWVKCGCGKLNAVSPAIVVKYLERVLSAGGGSYEERRPRRRSPGADLTDSGADVR